MHQTYGAYGRMLALVIYACNLGAFAYRARPFAHAHGEKEVTFIRHAESLGNLLGKKPWKYVYEAGQESHYAWRDGRLSESGKRYSQKRVMEDFDESLVDRILSAEVVYVSPLIRALETCIIVLSTAAKRKGVNVKQLFNKMKFVVTSDLREKLGSDSDKPGANAPKVNVPEFLETVVQEQARLHTRSGASDYKILTRKLVDSYIDEQVRSDFFEEDPDDAEKLLGSIERFRTELDAGSEKRVLIIGHNGWSRWNFAAGLQGLCVVNPWSNIAFGGRQVGELKNLGVLTAKFSQRKFHDMQVVGAEGTCTKKSKFGVFASLGEAKEASLIPRDTVVHHVFATKKMDISGLKGRWMTFSASAPRSFLAWSNEMGEPKKYIDLTTEGLRYACDHVNKAVIIDGRRYDNTANLPVWSESAQGNTTVYPFYFHPKDQQNMVDFKRLCLLVRVYVKFGADPQFIGTVLREIGWEDGGESAFHGNEWDLRWQAEHPDLAILQESEGEELKQLRESAGLKDEQSELEYRELRAKYMSMKG